MKNIYSLLLILLSITLNAQTKTWAGPDGFWSDETKWAPVGVPNSSNDVVIPTGTTLDIDQNAQAASITVNSGATMDISANLSLFGNSIFAAGSIVDLVSGQLSFTAGVTLTVTGMLNVTSELEKGLYGAGIVDVTAPGTINFEEGGTGAFSLGGAADLKIGPTGVMNIDEDLIFEISAFGSGCALINEGVINKTGGTGLTPVMVAYEDINGVSNIEVGTMEFSSSGTFNGGTFNVSGSAELIWSGSTKIVEGALTGVLDGPLTMASTLDVPDGASLSLDFTGSSHVIWSGAYFSAPGSVYNYSTIDVDGASTISGMTLYNHGTINMNAENSLAFIYTSTVLENEEDGIINLNVGVANNSQFGPANIYNSGLIKAQSGSGYSTIGARVTNEATGVIDVGAETIYFSSGYSGEGELRGSGAFGFGSNTSEFGGHLYPGESVGNIDHIGTWPFISTPETVYHLDINGTTPESEHDVFNVQTNVDLQGTFDINMGYDAQVDDEFVIMTFADTLANALPETVDLIYNGNSIIFDVVVSDTAVTLKVADIVLGLEDRRETFPGLSIGPNPTEGPITIAFAEYMENVDILIYDLNGRLISQTSMRGRDGIRIDSIEDPGVYLVYLESDDRRTVFRLVRK